MRGRAGEDKLFFYCRVMALQGCNFYLSIKGAFGGNDTPPAACCPREGWWHGGASVRGQVVLLLQGDRTTRCNFYLPIKLAFGGNDTPPAACCPRERSGMGGRAGEDMLFFYWYVLRLYSV
ncbi:uncharacterized protein LOC126428002 [Schistocerca serialis cubense]|uniref:uncharacterized protein LOC126428002 n=1 Tax=Schistocerca serialis cubense TaxID=2023355 RepID=UPI00214EDCAC|nr:uncharacterized protein LOC126428002 [Schistocerca serialis cubense]